MNGDRQEWVLGKLIRPLMNDNIFFVSCFLQLYWMWIAIRIFSFPLVLDYVNGVNSLDEETVLSVDIDVVIEQHDGRRE